jgi:hypothetical protein
MQQWSTRTKAQIHHTKQHQQSSRLSTPKHSLHFLSEGKPFTLILSFLKFCLLYNVNFNWKMKHTVRNEIMKFICGHTKWCKIYNLDLTWKHNEKSLKHVFLIIGPWSLKTFETWKDALQNKKPRSIKQKRNQH